MLSCARITPYPEIKITTDKSIIGILQEKSDRINSIKATLKLTPEIIKAPGINTYMSYRKGGTFRITGLSPTGFTLFDFRSDETLMSPTIIKDDENPPPLNPLPRGEGRYEGTPIIPHPSMGEGRYEGTPIIPPPSMGEGEGDRRGFSGDIDDKGGREFSNNFDQDIKRFRDISGIEIPRGIGIIKEAIDYYGIEGYPEGFFLIEDIKDYYILNQLRSEGDISYPIRRWWIEKRDMRVVRKEIFSELPERKGERLLEALYGDFKAVPAFFASLNASDASEAKNVDNIWTPFEVVIKGGNGKKLLRMKFDKVEYNK